LAISSVRSAQLSNFRRAYKTPHSGVHKDGIMRYRARKADCDTCGLKARCCPKQPQRKVTRSIYEQPAKQSQIKL